MSARHGHNTEVKPEMEMGEDKVHPELKEAAEDILRAIQNKSVIDLARALEMAFYVCDSYPHEEGSHMEDEE